MGKEVNMRKTIGQFDYRICKPKLGSTPFPATVHIVPKEYASEGDGWPLLSPGLMTEREIHDHVQELKKDLDRVCRLAKCALRNAPTVDRKMRASNEA